MGLKKIIFITGASRSGSTILSQVLGQTEGVAALGEVAYLWERGLKENRLCGCGETFRECDFWTDVVNLAYPDERTLDLDELLRTASSVERFRYLLSHLFSFFLPKFQARVRVLSENYLKIFCAASIVSNANCLVDSSKHMHGHVLVNTPDIDLFVIHLVRDGRATTFSWSRKKVLEEIPGQTIYFPRFNPLVAALHWLLDNVSAELLRLRARKFLRIRYEDFVTDPHKSVREILDFTDCFDAENPISKDSKTTLKVQHQVSGNPSRFLVGETLIKADNQWKFDMPKRTKFLISCVLSPLLIRYGYLSKP